MLVGDTFSPMLVLTRLHSVPSLLLKRIAGMHGIAERNVFVYWENADGSLELPPYIALCLATIKKRSAGSTVHLLGESTAIDYLDDLRDDWYQLPTIAHKVDYLRPRILNRYGGVFLDIDAICLDSVDRFFEPLDNYMVCGFGESPQKPFIGCLSSKSDSPLMREWAKRQDDNFCLQGNWTHFGAGQLWECNFDHTYQQYPLEQVEPFNWQLADKYDSNLDAAELIRSRTIPPILFALFNKVLPEKIKQMTETDLLAHKGFIGQCFRIGLELDEQNHSRVA